jgi:hypothetical protein
VEGGTADTSCPVQGWGSSRRTAWRHFAGGGLLKEDGSVFRAMAGKEESQHGTQK